VWPPCEAGSTKWIEGRESGGGVPAREADRNMLGVYKRKHVILGKVSKLSLSSRRMHLSDDVIGLASVTTVLHREAGTAMISPDNSLHRLNGGFARASQ